MELMKMIFTIAITMAITITLTMKGIGEVEENPPFEHTNDISGSTAEDQAMHHENKLVLPSKGGSRFLADVRNPRAADHCRKDNEVCHAQGRNYTCCNNKCMDLYSDNKNCGACKNKCNFTQACCRGECVYLAFDKRHCGRCNNRCERGEYCVYGMCDYA